MTPRIDLVPTPDGNMASPALAAAMWAIHDAHATPRPGVKPWRWLSCGCRTDGRMCVQHDPALAEFWRRNAPGAEFDQAEAAMADYCARESARLRDDLARDLAHHALAAAE